MKEFPTNDYRMSALWLNQNHWIIAWWQSDTNECFASVIFLCNIKLKRAIKCFYNLHMYITTTFLPENADEHRIVKECDQKSSLTQLISNFLKVSSFQKDLLVPWILPKNERKNSTYSTMICTSGWLVFVRFSEELKTPKSPFEINWPFWRVHTN